jgi:hypothetical protein
LKFRALKAERKQMGMACPASLLRSCAGWGATFCAVY